MHMNYTARPTPLSSILAALVDVLQDGDVIELRI